jgi:gliding motility-associated-like protein
VRPVKVNVTQLPEFSSITTSASTCEGATGKIIASSSLTGESYSINGGSLQATGNFFNLSPGFYTVTLQALNGCSKDSIVEVSSVISTNAYFTANPAQGAPPLWVNFSNQSTNASNFEWFLNGVSQGNNYNSALFDTTGIYNIELIAWPNNPACADTFSLNIHVFDSLIVQIPNVFTPNNDGKNDIFGINTNLPVTVEYQLFNRWGNEIISGTKSNAISTSTNAYFTTLWDGKDATEGVYFYKMKIKAVSEGKIWEENMEGFLELLR